MLTVSQIEKNFGKKQALADLSLKLEEGHIFGMLGTNGAGKSTLLRVMSGILRADQGSVLLDDAPVFENPDAKQKICYLSDEPTFLPNATIAEMGRMQAAYYPYFDAAKLRDLCLRFTLPMNERITGFSKGTQKRAQICLGLSLNPRVLLCDETFDGLDPVMRDSFKRVLSQETIDRGLITVLAGHNQQEMEDICDSVGFLHEGRLVCSGDLDSMLGDVHRVQLIPEAEVSDDTFAPFHPLRLQRQGRLCMLTLRGDKAQLEQKLASLNPLFMEFLPLSLEEIFILEMEDRGYAQH
ncbi:MAG: ABC transporter ATP-binding protein [Clostridiales bacterium]|nr:ABC transporter ATP-binding protein [Clostridiales bacterium]